MGKLGTAVVVAFLVARGVAAATDDASGASDEKPTEAREEVVVTASRHGQKVTEAPAAVSVITAEEIATAGYQSLPDVLRRIPGLDLMQASPRDYNVSARGFNNVLARRLLVLIDGRSVYVNMMGFVMWDAIQVAIDDIERIEVVRGPGSTLYGANAVAGVIAIITKSPKDLHGTYARLAYGEGSALDVGVVSGQRLPSFGYKVSASYFQSDAFENPDRNPNSGFQEPGETATRQPKAALHIERERTDGARLLLDLGFSGASGVLYTGIGPLDIEEGSRGSYARAAWQREDLFVQAWWSRLDGSTLNLTSQQENHFTTDTFDVEAQWNRGIGLRQYLVVGANARGALIDSDLTAGKESQGLYGAYAQDEIRVGRRFTFCLGLRADVDELTGASYSPRAGVVIALDERNSLRVTAARAYGSPSFIESYLDYGYEPVPGLRIAARGNRELSPETIGSYEIGLKSYPSSVLSLDAALFYAALDDNIQFRAIEEYAPGIPKTFSYVNAGQARERGAELAFEYDPTARVSLLAHYAFTDSDGGGDVNDVAARHKAGATIQYARERGPAGSLGVFYSSELRFREQAPFYEAGVVPAYTVVHGAAYWRFRADGSVAVGLRGTNLLDRRHREFIAGDIIERRLMAELKLRF